MEIKTQLLEKITALQKVIVVHDKNESLQQGRVLALEYLKLREFSEADTNLITDNKILTVLQDYYDDLLQVGGIPEEVVDYAQVLCTHQCNYNFLSFDEITDSELYSRYVYNDYSEQSDLLQLISLSLCYAGSILYVYDDEQIDTEIILQANRQLPPGYHVIMVVDTNAHVRITNTMYQQFDTMLTQTKLFCEERTTCTYDILIAQLEQKLNYHNTIIRDKSVVTMNRCQINSAHHTPMSVTVHGHENTVVYNELLVVSDGAQLHKENKFVVQGSGNNFHATQKTVLLDKVQYIDATELLMQGNASENTLLFENTGLVVGDKIMYEVQKNEIIPSNDNTVTIHNNFAPISEEQEAYLQCRGLPADTAVFTLVSGFFETVMHASFPESIQQFVTGELKNLLLKK